MNKMNIIWYDNQWVPLSDLYDGCSQKISMGCFSITIHYKEYAVLADDLYCITVWKYGDLLFKCDGIAYTSVIHRSNVIVVVFPCKTEAYAFTKNKMYKLKLPDNYDWHPNDLITYDEVNQSIILVQKGISLDYDIFSYDLYNYYIYRGTTEEPHRYSVCFQNFGKNIQYTLNDFNGTLIDSYPLHYSV